MGEMDGRRHQIRGLAAGKAEHDALVAGAFVLVAGGIDALGDVHRLLVDEALDMRMLPVEALLFVADVLDRVARDLDEQILGDRFGAAHFAGEDDPIGRA